MSFLDHAVEPRIVRSQVTVVSGGQTNINYYYSSSSAELYDLLRRNGAFDIAFLVETVVAFVRDSVLHWSEVLSLMNGLRIPVAIWHASLKLLKTRVFNDVIRRLWKFEHTYGSFSVSAFSYSFYPYARLHFPLDTLLSPLLIRNTLGLKLLRELDSLRDSQKRNSSLGLNVKGSNLLLDDSEGVSSSGELWWDPQRCVIWAKASTWLTASPRNAELPEGITPLSFSRHLYTVAAASQLTYAAGSCLKVPLQSKRNITNAGSKWMAHEPEGSRRRVTPTLINTAKTNPGDLYEFGAKLFSIPQKLCEIHAAAMPGVIALPDIHPLYEIVSGSYGWDKRPTLESAVETISKVNELRTKSLSTAPNRMHTYSSETDGNADAEGLPRNLGYSVAVTRPVVYDAVAVGVPMALLMIKDTGSLPSAIIHIDSQAVQRALEEEAKPSRHAMNPISRPTRKLDSNRRKGFSNSPSKLFFHAVFVTLSPPLAVPPTPLWSEISRNSPRFDIVSSQLLSGRLPWSLSGFRQSSNAQTVSNRVINFCKSPSWHRLPMKTEEMKSNRWIELMDGPNGVQTTIAARARKAASVSSQNALDAISKLNQLSFAPGRFPINVKTLATKGFFD